MNTNHNSNSKRNQKRSHMHNKNKRYMNRNYQQRQKPELIGSTQYLCLNHEDLLYPGNFSRFKISQFQKILRKLASDFNFLLHLQYNDFWKEIKTSSTLKKSLISCIQIFPLQKFNRHISGPQKTQINQIFNNDNYLIWKELVRIVLFIYHRIVCDSRQNQKQYIYDQWLCDIPKILNLVQVYGETSPKIIQQILNNLFEALPDYKYDIQDFLRIIHQSVIDQFFKDLQFEYNKKIIKKASLNFNNATNSFAQNLMKSLFGLYDGFSSLENYLKYFPKFYKWQFVSDEAIHCQLFDCYMIYIDRINGGWQIDKQLRILIDPIIQKIRQTMIQFLCRSFLELKDLIKQYRPHQVWVQGLRTYYEICKQLQQDKQNKQRNKKWRQLFIWINAQNPKQQLFVLTKDIQQRLKKQNKDPKIIKYCQQFYANKKKGYSEELYDDISDPIHIINQLPAISDWNYFNINQNIDSLTFTSNSFNIDGDHSLFFNPHQYSLDNDLLISQSMVKKQNFNKLSQYIKKDKFTEYDDDPEQTGIPPIIGIQYQISQMQYDDQNCQVQQKGIYSRKTNKMKINTTMSMIQKSYKINSTQQSQYNTVIHKGDRQQSLNTILEQDNTYKQLSKVISSFQNQESSILYQNPDISEDSIQFSLLQSKNGPEFDNNSNFQLEPQNKDISNGYDCDMSMQQLSKKQDSLSMSYYTQYQSQLNTSFLQIHQISPQIPTNMKKQKIKQSELTESSHKNMKKKNKNTNIKKKQKIENIQKQKKKYVQKY